MAPVKTKKISIYTLSEELGVSPATVSKALNNHPTISADVRTKIRQVADKLHFKPRVVSTKSTNICVLIQQFKGHPLDFDEYVSLIMEGVAEYCQDEKLEMSIYGANAEAMNRSDIVRELRRRCADGAIVLRASDESYYLRQLEQQKFPYIDLFDQIRINKDKTFSVDTEKVGYEATRYLMSLGHRKIGMIRDSDHFYSVNACYNGYVKALREVGIEPDDRYVFMPNHASTSQGVMLGWEGMKVLKLRVPDMTAVLATSDNIAGKALAWLYKNKISIPDQLSVMGISDFPDAEFFCPALTTYRIPYKQIAYEGARQLHRQCRGLDLCIKDTVMENLEPKLIVRDSTGPIR